MEANNNNNSTSKHAKHTYVPVVQSYIEPPRTVALTHFCEQHGPSIVFTTQMFHSNTNLYTFPSSFERARKNIPHILRKMKPSEKISFQFSSSPSDSHVSHEPSLNNNNHDFPIQPTFKHPLEGTTFSYTETDKPGTPSPSPVEVPKQTEQTELSPLPKDELNTTTLPQFSGENVLVISEKPSPAIVEIAIKTPNDVGASASVCSACSSLTEGIGYFSVRDNPDVSMPSTNIRRSRHGRTDTSHSWNIVSSHFPEPSTYSTVRSATVRSLSWYGCDVIALSVDSEFVPGREGVVIFGADNESPRRENAKRPPVSPTPMTPMLPEKPKGPNYWVLSFQFKLFDIKARGNHRWYSFVVVLADQIKLILHSNFIEKCFTDLAASMLELSKAVYDKETESEKNISYRAPMRTYGMFRREGGRTPLRSLTDLLGDKDFYLTLHQRFGWILHMLETSLKIHHIPSLFQLLESMQPRGKDVPKEEHEKEKKEKPKGIFQTFGFLYGFIGRNFVKDLVWNTVAGNQIVVRSESVSTAASFIKLLQRLLPEDCCKTELWSQEYEESWRCNFLGIPDTVEIPSHVDSKAYLLVDIGHTASHTYKLKSTGPKCGKSALVRELDRILSAKLPKKIENMRIKALKQEWIHKTRLFCALARVVENSKDPRIPILLEKLQLRSDDLLILKFWLSGIKKQLLKEPQFQIQWGQPQTPDKKK